MSRRRVLLLLKSFDVYPPAPRIASPAGPLSSSPPRGPNPKVFGYLDDRCRVHTDTIKFCQDVLRRKTPDWESLSRNDLSEPIRHVDLVITIGGDGTLLRASHFLDDSIPVLGVNSDPTRITEVEEHSDEFDATRSTGFLCAATAENFEQVLDEILEDHRHPSELTRISVNLNDRLLPTYSLNDILVAHPCPATVSRFSFRIRSNLKISSLVNCRSSGLRVSTAAGSTAAMLSAGGFPMQVSSRELQYMAREPISPRVAEAPLMHGIAKPDQSMEIVWYSKEGAMYVDGSNVIYSLQHGDTIVISTKAPFFKVFLPQVLSK